MPKMFLYIHDYIHYNDDKIQQSEKE